MKRIAFSTFLMISSLLLPAASPWASAVPSEFTQFLAAAPEPLDPSFFANEGFLLGFPGASALHADSQEFVHGSAGRAFADGDALIAAMRAESGLLESIARFPEKSRSERIRVMNQVFEIETQASGLPPPELVLDDAAKKSAFFEFDPARPGRGKVILNPEKLFSDPNPYAALLFLIHETRHSYQFQMAFSRGASASRAAATAYQKGFTAQRLIFDQGKKVSFCDFLTLNHEYEAFLFGNYVLETLTEGAVDTSDMGTLASQFVPGAGLRVDLSRLAKSVEPGALLDAFNELEKVQYDELHPQ